MSDRIAIIENYYVDDHLLSTDVTNLSFKRFIKEGMKEETRTDVHRFFFWGLMSILGLGFVLYKGVIAQDFRQKIIYLEPDESSYRYNPNILEKEVRAYVDKINLINKHSQQMLMEAKERA